MQRYKITLAPRVRPSGRLYGVETLECSAPSEEEALQRLIDRTKWHYAFGRKIYDRNHRAARLIGAGDYIVQVLSA